MNAEESNRTAPGIDPPYPMGVVPEFYGVAWHDIPEASRWVTIGKVVLDLWDGEKSEPVVARHHFSTPIPKGSKVAVVARHDPLAVQRGSKPVEWLIIAFEPPTQ